MKYDPDQLKFLRSLEAGDAFEEAVGVVSGEPGSHRGAQVAFQCLLAGYISQGELTDLGRQVLRDAWLAEGIASA